ncbi:hypothetical protein FB451DRAFT_1367102 [Mycena latifolia]|nr:hypothetical protein FB451DRAFT_1367102 [Mycena latifolia]
MSLTVDHGENLERAEAGLRQHAVESDPLFPVSHIRIVNGHYDLVPVLGCRQNREDIAYLGGISTAEQHVLEIGGVLEKRLSNGYVVFNSGFPTKVSDLRSGRSGRESSQEKNKLPRLWTRNSKCASRGGADEVEASGFVSSTKRVGPQIDGVSMDGTQTMNTRTTRMGNAGFASSRYRDEIETSEYEAGRRVRIDPAPLRKDAAVSDPNAREIGAPVHSRQLRRVERPANVAQSQLMHKREERKGGRVNDIKEVAEIVCIYTYAREEVASGARQPPLANEGRIISWAGERGHSKWQRSMISPMSSCESSSMIPVERRKGEHTAESLRGFTNVPRIPTEMDGKNQGVCEVLEEVMITIKDSDKPTVSPPFVQSPRISVKFQ